MAYHSSRAHQNAMCREDCEDGHLCYLGDTGADCVVGREVLPYTGQQPASFKCCTVKRDSLFNRTVRAILIYADLAAQPNTQQYRTALRQVVNALNIPPFVGLNQPFYGGGIDLEPFDKSRGQDLLDLLERIHPDPGYFVYCFFETVLEQSAERRRNPNINYHVSVYSNKELIDNTAVIAANFQWNVYFRATPAILVHFVRTVLELRQPVYTDAQLQIALLEPIYTKISRRLVEALKGYVAASLFRGTLCIHSRNNVHIVENDVEQGGSTSHDPSTQARWAIDVTAVSIKIKIEG